MVLLAAMFVAALALRPQLVGVGMAIAGALLPVAVKVRFGLAAVPDAGMLWTVMAGLAIGAVFPLRLAMCLDATGSFSASLWALFGTALLLVCACVPLSATRLRPV